MPKAIMEALITHLLRINDPLSDTTNQEVKELLKTPLGELDEIDEQISNLQAQVKSLEERRNEIQKCVDNYQLLLSPIRRLPDDALYEIFYHCLPTHRNSIISSSEAPVLLTHTAADGELDLEGASNVETRELRTRALALAVLENRCKFVETWLRRTGSCPLSISIYYSNCHNRTLEDIEAAVEDPDDLTYQLLKIISSFSERWETFELTMPPNVYCRYEPKIFASPDALRSLTTLRLNLYHTEVSSPGGHDIPTPIPLILLGAPQVHKLSLVGGPYELADMASHPLFGRQLTHFSCHLSFNCAETLMLFKAYEPRSSFRAFDLKWLLVNADPGSESSVILPHLEVFEWSPGLVADKTVLQFIIQRMDPLAASGVAALKRVWIIFARGQELDILEEVRRHQHEKLKSESVQLFDVKLELNYPLLLARKEPNQLSSSHGLNNRNRTWDYPANTY